MKKFKNCGLTPEEEQQAREAYNEYQRDYWRRHKEQRRKINARYWATRGSKLRAERRQEKNTQQ